MSTRARVHVSVFSEYARVHGQSECGSVRVQAFRRVRACERACMDAAHLSVVRSSAEYAIMTNVLS